MKRKNLRQAVVLGLVLASFGSCVWAAEQEFEYGLKFNTGISSSDQAKFAVNGIYNLGDESTVDDYVIQKEGFILASNESLGELVKEVNITTNGDITINKSKRYLDSTNGMEGAIDLVVDRNFSSNITGSSMYINNVVDSSKRSFVAGINMTAGNGYTNKLYIDLKKDIVIKDFAYSIHVEDNSIVDIDANNINFVKESSNSVRGIYSRNSENSEINLTAKNDINFINNSQAIYLEGDDLTTNLSSENDINIINNQKSILNGIESILNIYDTTGDGLNTFLTADNNIDISNYKCGIYMGQTNNNVSLKNTIDLKAGKNIKIHDVETGIYTAGSTSEIFLDSNNENERTNTNLINADKQAIVAEDKSNIFIAGKNNTLIGGTDAVTSSKGANVDITGADNFIGNTANGTGTLAEQERHALYASNAGSINVTANGGMNTIVSDGYRTIHAEGDGILTTADINITGGVYIANKNAFPSVKSALADENISKIAIVASSNGILANGVVNIDLNGTNTIRSGISDDNYKGDYAGGNVIYGSVIAGKDGKVNINTNLPSTMTLADTSGIRGSISVYGNVMAGNKGELNLDLGNGGYLEGRVDDYQDAAIKDVNESHGAGFYNPEFSKEITDRGEVNLTMGDKAYWNVTGQSWVSSLTATGEGAVIDMVGEDNGTHAVTIENMQGNANFKMSLNGETKTDSDMLYMKHAEGSYNIYLDRIVTDSEIGEDGLRFATVGDGSSAEFKVFASDKGFFDKEYTVGSEDYIKGASENSEYNGNSLDNRKPGEDAVDNYFDGTYTNGITVLADNGEGLLEKDTNFKLVGSSSEISDGGETILNMSRANYSNAVYMDRLNKRLGEARYIDGDEGIWMRLRHDRIGKQDDFRSMNTMYEIGYDRKADVDNGQRRIGIAGDYMRGSTEYIGVSGSGEIKRIGLWAYDTWLGDKGHYTDYVVKWGHLSNDFNLFRNEKISGDYSNDVFSVSAEYGKKNDIGGDWYFEPQAQLQYAYVTDAQYSSSQGTEVDVDSIHSLIARGGFRIGKDFGSEKKSTVYFKADIMHEFLGDQDIAVRDSSTDGRWTAVGYGNEGTWFDVGFGFAAQTGDNSYVYLDLEQSFGNDNEDTYQINAGMQWSF